MIAVFRLFPEQAAATAKSLDLLMLAWVAVATGFTLLIAGLICYFSIRYRFTANVGRRITHSNALHWAVEIGWMVIPFAILLVFFAVGAKMYVADHRSPTNPLDISVVGKQWMWKVAHTRGRREINQLHVPVGQPVRLRMTSEDVIHSFYIPAFRVKQDVLPGRYTALWFTPTQPGDYHLFCAEFCGTDHSRMRGTVTVMSAEDYAEWAASGTEPPDQAGRRLMQTHGCVQCHATGGVGPSLIGLLGRKVRLVDGRTVVADEEFVRRAILDPGSEVLQGHQPIMPSFAGQIDPAEIDLIIGYLKSTGRPIEGNR